MQLLLKTFEREESVMATNNTTHEQENDLRPEKGIFWPAMIGVLLIARVTTVLIEVRRIAKRLGEEKIGRRYLLYDLFSPMYAIWLRILQLRKDERVWR